MSQGKVLLLCKWRLRKKELPVLTCSKSVKKFNIFSKRKEILLMLKLRID